MKKRFNINNRLGFLLILLIGGLVVSLSLSKATQAQTQPINKFQPHSLLAVSLEEVGQTAITFTKVRYRVITGVPEVALSRAVTTAELPSLGLSRLDFAGEEPPLALVILKGDFDVSRGSRVANSSWHWRVNYIAYVFDLRAGVPTLTQTSPNGGYLRKALNNPNLPDDGPIAPIERGTTKDAVPISPLPTANKLPYGSVVPPVATPSNK